jgi:acyl-CoA thioester hydrolase
MQIDWLLPARLDDLLDVSVHSVVAGAARLGFKQEMRRQTDQALLATAEVMAVCLDAGEFKPIKIPEHIRSEIENVQ